ncbi:MAG: hypothetical protein AAB434_10140, partial [Planctomycetota bacterium]
MRPVLTSFALLLLAAVPSRAEESYLPLAEGATWTYEIRKVAKVAGFVSAKKEGTATCSCVKLEKVGDVDAWILAWDGEGEDPPSGRIWVQGGVTGVVVAKSDADELWVLPADFDKTECEVEIAGEGGGITVSSKIEKAEEEIEVPAGTFKCRKVTSRVNVGGGVKTERIVWYAKGVGIVKIAKRA